jgi:hypothetical protein
MALEIGLLRPGMEKTLYLCQCSCHAGCDLAAEPSAQFEAWLQECSCPGAESAQRSWMEHDRDWERRWPRAEVDWGQRWRHARERQAAWNALDDAVRAQATGKTRQEVREILVEQIRDRGLPTLSEPMLEMRLEWIYVGRSPVERAKLLGEVAVGLLGIPLRLRGIFVPPTRRLPGQTWSGHHGAGTPDPGRGPGRRRRAYGGAHGDPAVRHSAGDNQPRGRRGRRLPAGATGRDCLIGGCRAAVGRAR